MGSCVNNKTGTKYYSVASSGLGHCRRIAFANTGFAKLVQPISLSLLDTRDSLIANQVQSLPRIRSFTEPKIAALILSRTVANTSE